MVHATHRLYDAGGGHKLVRSDLSTAQSTEMTNYAGKGQKIIDERKERQNQCSSGQNRQHKSSGSTYPGASVNAPNLNLSLFYQFVRKAQEEWLGADDCITAGADHLNGFAPGLGIDLFQNSMNVIPYCKLR